MNDESRPLRRPRQLHHPENTPHVGRSAISGVELVERLELRERLQAIIAELDRLDADVDVPRTIAEGALEELELLLAADEEQA